MYPKLKHAATASQSVYVPGNVIWSGGMPKLAGLSSGSRTPLPWKKSSKQAPVSTVQTTEPGVQVGPACAEEEEDVVEEEEDVVEEEDVEDVVELDVAAKNEVVVKMSVSCAVAIRVSDLMRKINLVSNVQCSYVPSIVCSTVDSAARKITLDLQNSNDFHDSGSQRRRRHRTKTRDRRRGCGSRDGNRQRRHRKTMAC